MLSRPACPGKAISAPCSRRIAAPHGWDSRDAARQASFSRNERHIATLPPKDHAPARPHGLGRGGAVRQRVHAAPGGGTAGPTVCDALLLRPDAPARLTLLSAASVHNALLLRDKPLLTSLYAASPALGDGIAFQVSGGVFAGYRGPAVPEAAVPETLRTALEAPGLSLSMQGGDVLVLNPFLVWLRDRPEASHLALRASQTRMDFPEWAPPMQSLAAAG